MGYLLIAAGVVFALLLGGLKIQTTRISHLQAEEKTLEATVKAKDAQLGEYVQTIAGQKAAADRQNTAVLGWLAQADARRAAAAAGAAANAKAADAAAAEVERIRNLQPTVPGDTCASACSLLRSPL